MDTEEKLKFEYEQVLAHWRSLADIRFKLLAIVPALAGAALAVAASGRPPGFESALGTVGFFATLGIVFYDQRNTQLYNDAMSRAKWLEQKLHFGSHAGKDSNGGLFLSRPRRSLRLFGIVLMWHDRGLSIVYSVALATWVFLAVHGFLTSSISTYLLEILVKHSLRSSAVIAFGFGLLFYIDLMRKDVDVDKAHIAKKTDSGSPPGGEA